MYKLLYMWPDYTQDYAMPSVHVESSDGVVLLFNGD